MSATNQTNDYFSIIDLNPTTASGPFINDPRDRRGHNWFGFVSQAQRLSLQFGTNPPPPGVRVLYSFDYDYFTGVGAAGPSSVRPHGVLQMNSPSDQDQMIIEFHDRPFVCLWLDPTGTQPQPGQTLQVEVKAWRQGMTPGLSE